ncbi:hypothetical protein D1646_16250 [Pseudoflavonifractor sp. 60]|uniref:protein kinase domain-containing protein n=1 Tax=Pseudoflavonifractor sp. 60 TaxID=2304576 RepID=UPI00136B9C27|nr:protein kinase [Pseudoflavonifractor sp. 60]NBI68323.1 hypothetical protein [Pseudoflavonifractor sp. 60]
MSATTQTLCYNCFRSIADPAAPCPHCGFDLEENRQKFPVALRAGTVLNNRYIVGRVLGQGGFGITYVAFDTQLQARVAIKEYMPNEIATRIEGTTVSVAMDTRADDFTYGAERFQEEARTLAKFIGHPNIAGVSSYFDQNDTSYFVMDYIEGVSFKSYIANNGGKVSVDETLNVMIPVLRALTAVHAEGFIHRDVTPDNIYISKDGNVKLLDFGSARYSIGDKSKSLDVILKVGYAPKEQYIRRGRQGPYTDVYSCAACFYAALTGYLPPESLERLDHDELVPVSQAGVDIPEWLDKAILKGLAVQPEDRFQSAAEFLDAIENQLVVDVPAAGQTAPAPQKKPKTALIAGVAAALVVVVGVGAFLAGRGGGGMSPDSSAPGTGGGGGGGLIPMIDMLGPKVTIAGREYSANVEELDLNDLGRISFTEEDLQTIQGMANLKRLRMYSNSMTDLQWVSQMTQLEQLEISGENAIYENLDFLSGLTGLEVLRLPITAQGMGSYDISALANLTELTTISIPHSVKDLTPLQNLTKLESLSLEDGYMSMERDSFTSLEPLKNLVNLKRLYIRVTSNIGKEPVDLMPLAGLTNMEDLSINVDNYVQENGVIYCSISSLSALSEMQKLQSLTLRVGGLTDISPLRELKNLDTLIISDVSGAKITDWSPVDHVATVVGRD